MLDNADKLISKLDKLAKVDNLNEVLNQACILVENQAKINCPVKYGTLRNSITHEVEGLQGVVGTNIEYAPYVELGTGLFATDGDGRKTPWSYQDDNMVSMHKYYFYYPKKYLNNKTRRTIHFYIKNDKSKLPRYQTLDLSVSALFKLD